MKKLPVLKSFAPVADRNSRILVLGTMPGPEALRRGEYYGFPGNHFWKILPDIFGEPHLETYAAKMKFLRRRRIAVWDTIRQCVREGAADGAIERAIPNDVAGLLARNPGIRTVFLNGGLAAKLYRKHSAASVRVPSIVLPSTSPAHASISYEEKKRRWRAILEPLGV